MAKKATAEKNPPSVSLEELLAAGQVQIVAKVAGKEVLLGIADPRSFSSGSYGYGLSGKANVPVGDKFARLQMSCNLVVIGSKPSDKGENSDAA